MNSRRNILGIVAIGSMAAGGAAAGIVIRPMNETCQIDADHLAAKMAAIHGGAWRVSMDADFILISRYG